MEREKPSTESGTQGSDRGGTQRILKQPDQDHVFSTGAKRSEIKPFYSAIPGASLRRLALRATGAPRGEVLSVSEFQYTGGSRGYGYNNWKMGLPMRDTFNHVIEHLFRWKDKIEGPNQPADNEDDLAAAAWGIMFPLMTFERSYINNRGEDPNERAQEKGRSTTPEVRRIAEEAVAALGRQGLGGGVQARQQSTSGGASVNRDIFSPTASAEIQGDSGVPNEELRCAVCQVLLGRANSHVNSGTRVHIDGINYAFCRSHFFVMETF